MKSIANSMGVNSGATSAMSLCTSAVIISNIYYIYMGFPGSSAG